MNRVITSFNTFFLIVLFLSLIFSIFSLPKLNIDEEQSIRVNFYELIQDDNQLFNSSIPDIGIKKETP